MTTPTIPAQRGQVAINRMLQMPTRIRLLTEAELPYAWAPEPVDVQLLLLPALILTHANDLAWAPLRGMLAAERVDPPEAWEVEQLHGPNAGDPTHWVPIARNGLEMHGGTKDGRLGLGQVIRIPRETLIFGGRVR